MNELTLLGIFTLAGIPVTKHWRLPNGYITTRDGESDADILKEAVYRHRSPWWLVKTPWGLIELGWRKRVIDIDWSDTPVRAILTEDDVTKDKTYIHAYGEEKAVTYLRALGLKLASIGAKDNPLQYEDAPAEAKARIAAMLSSYGYGLGKLSQGEIDYLSSVMAKAALGVANSHH